MKKAVIILMMILAMPMALAQAEISTPSLNVSLLKYQPVPAHPGDILDVWIQVSNRGGSIARNVQMQFMDNYPFYLESDSRRVHDVGLLSGGYDYVAKFQVRVAQNAPIGDAYMKASYSAYSTSNKRVEVLMPVDIDSRITALSIENVGTNPDSLTQGQQAELQIEVKNQAQSTLRNVKMKLDLDSVPITPVSSASEKKIDILEPGATHIFTYNVIPELDAEANAYSVPVDVSFTDDSGNTVSYDDVVGIVISGDPELITTVDSSQVYTNQRTGTITLKFVNKGVDEIKFLYITIPESEDFKLLSPTNDFYIGNIDSDDYEVQDIKIEALNGETLDIPINLEFRDSANKPHERTDTITLNLVEKPEEEGGGFGTTLFVIVVVAGAAYFFWRRRKKNAR